MNQYLSVGASPAREFACKAGSYKEVSVDFFVAKRHDARSFLALNITEPEMNTLSFSTIKLHTTKLWMPQSINGIGGVFARAYTPRGLTR